MRKSRTMQNSTPRPPVVTKLKGLGKSARWSQWTRESPRSRKWSLSPISTAPCERNTVDHTRLTTRVIVVVLILMALPPKGMGAQVTRISPNILASNVRMTKSAKGLILPRSSARKSRKPFASSQASTRNVAQMTKTVTVILTTVHDAAGQIAQGKLICVRNIN